MAAEANTEKVNKTKKKWWIPVLIIYLVLVNLVLVISIGLNIYLAAPLVKAKIEEIKAEKEAEAELEAAQNGEVYDYTIAGEIIGKSSSDVGEWLAKYYGSYTITQETPDYSAEYWTVKFDERQPSIEVEGCIMPVDYIVIDLDYDGNIRNVGFETYAQNEDAFVKYRKSFVKKLGDPDYSSYTNDEYMLFDYCTWERFDGTYTLFISRLVNAQEAHMGFSICSDAGGF